MSRKPSTLVQGRKHQGAWPSCALGGACLQHPLGVAFFFIYSVRRASHKMLARMLCRWCLGESTLGTNKQESKHNSKRKRWAHFQREGGGSGNRYRHFALSFENEPTSCVCCCVLLFLFICPKGGFPQTPPTEHVCLHFVTSLADRIKQKHYTQGVLAVCL